jgi:hypothetical protein
MIELQNQRLVFTFPQVHAKARLRVEFQRTLRIPDDGASYPLPPGFGPFPLRHVDDFAQRVPRPWLEHGGVMLPIYQSEALWIRFTSDPVPDRDVPYPFAIKVAAGKVNALTGARWTDALSHAPQDYMVAPLQPWLDGYCVKRGAIRQFVAMPLGAGYSAEEQLTQLAEHGGLQVLVTPMSRAAFDRRFPGVHGRARAFGRGGRAPGGVLHSAAADMGLAPGGVMEQEIFEDPFDPADWDAARRSRCFVHLANSLVWSAITGEPPTAPPPTARDYAQSGLPWFAYYEEGGAGALPGAQALAELRSVLELGNAKGDDPLPENESVEPQRVIALRGGVGERQVREPGVRLAHQTAVRPRRRRTR